jgi:hypothetical protein
MRFGWVLAVVLAGCTFRHGAMNGSDGSVAGDVATPHDTTGSGDGDGSAITAWRKAITIQGSMVSNTVASFPVWFDLTDSELAAHARADGSDIYFTDASDAAIPYQIQRWDPASGHLLAWFLAAQLTKNTNATFYIRYGGMQAAPAQDPPSVFAAYAAVWHMDDPLAGAAPMVSDAKGAAPGTSTNLTASRQVAAQLGGGIDFNGSTMYVTFDNMVTGNTSSTFSAWVNERSANGMDAIVTVGSPATSQSRFLYAVYQNNNIGAGLWNNDWQDVGTNVQNTSWTLLHWTFDGSNNKSTVYQNGAVLANHTFASGANTTGTTAAGWIGFAPAGWGTNYLNGILDEVRISKSVLSPDWIGIEYANQKSPSTFYSVGAAEAAP